MERIVAQDSGSTVIAHRAGFVDQVDANRIVIRVTENNEKELVKSVGANNTGLGLTNRRIEVYSNFSTIPIYQYQVQHSIL